MSIDVQCCRRVNEFSRNTPDVFCKCEYNEARRLRFQPTQPTQTISLMSRYMNIRDRSQAKATV